MNVHPEFFMFVDFVSCCSISAEGIAYLGGFASPCLRVLAACVARFHFCLHHGDSWSVRSMEVEAVVSFAAEAVVCVAPWRVCMATHGSLRDLKGPRARERRETVSAM